MSSGFAPKTRSTKRLATISQFLRPTRAVHQAQQPGITMELGRNRRLERAENGVRSKARSLFAAYLFARINRIWRRILSSINLHCKVHPFAPCLATRVMQWMISNVAARKVFVKPERHMATFLACDPRPSDSDLNVHTVALGHFDLLCGVVVFVY
jgi:hypothetical protein